MVLTRDINSAMLPVSRSWTTYIAGRSRFAVPAAAAATTWSRNSFFTERISQTACGGGWLSNALASMEKLCRFFWNSKQQARHWHAQCYNRSLTFSKVIAHIQHTYATYIQNMFYAPSLSLSHTHTLLLSYRADSLAAVAKVYGY